MNDFISRKALIAEFKEKCNGECGCCEYNDSGFDTGEKCRLIYEAPTADVQPVKRGKDVCDSITDRHCEFKCSLCGEEMLEVWCDNEFNYCPFCGALMQEEE